MASDVIGTVGHFTVFASLRLAAYIFRPDIFHSWVFIIFEVPVAASPVVDVAE